MQECFQRFPELYKDYNDDEEEEEQQGEGEGEERGETVSSAADTEPTEASPVSSTSKQLTSTATSS